MTTEVNTKPECNLSECDGNVYAIIGRVSKTLKRANLPETAKEFSDKALNAKDYDEVLRLCFEYVDVT
jgi:hypothetical protein